MAWLAEDCSTSGATTRTSPKRLATRARVAIPGLYMPSSFDTRICMVASARATLIHNPSAGDAKPAADDLKAILADAGFQVHYRSTRKGWKKALAREADLVVAAGGDGTVAEVGRELSGTGVPLALLPGGTANNIARTLGIVGDARAHAQSWHDATARPFDVGVINSGDRARRFVESVGGGVF